MKDATDLSGVATIEVLDTDTSSKVYSILYTAG